ncbi:hypothetical protein NEHOM01_1896 [Nematocida homosporus]|uniref:uncharacterized protein n=1 Tax=Nematocida homosporus TaxID=1912981 RepID=UPI00221EE93E|nr:uncharacterized protein NEHOM01_1896 [Nematocida homosporus]KAI5187057.1 hypothetical protein NEHOM01_1896 [Nematocida homosporus]
MPRLSISEGNDQIRKEYIELMAETKEKRKSSSEGSSGLYSIYCRANALLDSVTNAPELRLDANVAGEVVDLESSRLAKLCAGDRVTPEEFISLLKDQPSGLHTDYITTIFRGCRLPAILVLKEEEEIRPRKAPRKPLEALPLEVPNTTAKPPQDQIDAPDKIKRIYQILQEQQRLPVLQLAIVPNDFAKTIENLLYLSFAVRIERAFLVQENNTLYVTCDKDPQAVQSSHLILTTTQEEVEKAIQEFQITRALLE